MPVNQCDKCWRTLPSSFVQRGLSLVEVMIILAVVGLVLGASIMPFDELANTDSYEREQRKINTARTAIIGYAANHRTTESTVFIIGEPDVAGDPDTRRPIVLPAGRPYLPCPDIDGDGYEDRQSFDVTGEVLTVAVHELTIDIDDATDNDLVQVGNCALSRGNLPWKTLGVPPADGWGNRYTYQVDDIYSNALVGFGQNSKIDSFDIRWPVMARADGRLFFQIRIPNVAPNLMRNGDVLVVVNRRRPIVVCGNLPVSFGDQTDITCELGGRFPLVAGQRSNVDFEAPRRLFTAADGRNIVEGVPYVLVSHGKNGLGAVNHELSLRLGGPVCNAPVHSTALRPSPIAQIDAIRHEIVNFPFAEATTQPTQFHRCTVIDDHEDGRFLHQSRADQVLNDLGNDDIVVWMTGQELLQEMTRAEIFPVDSFPLLRPY